MFSFSSEATSSQFFFYVSMWLKKTIHNFLKDKTYSFIKNNNNYITLKSV